VSNLINLSRLLFRTSPCLPSSSGFGVRLCFLLGAYILIVLRREVEAKEIGVMVAITFDAKSSEAEEILVHYSEDK